MVSRPTSCSCWSCFTDGSGTLRHSLRRSCCLCGPLLTRPHDSELQPKLQPWLLARKSVLGVPWVRIGHDHAQEQWSCREFTGLVPAGVDPPPWGAVGSAPGCGG